MKRIFALGVLLVGCVGARHLAIEHALPTVSDVASRAAAASPTPAPSASSTGSPAAIAAASASALASSAAASPGTLSPALRRGGATGKLHSPMPGGFLGGWDGDTGIDIAGNRLDVHAIGAGTLDYSEWGHTLWRTKPDTAYSIRLALDEPIPFKGHAITHVYYTHLSKVVTEQAEGLPRGERKHVEAGEKIAVSGIGNGVPHLHLGLLLDNQVEQDSWTFILREGEIRKVMGDYRNGELLPRK